MSFLRGALDVGEKAFDWLTDKAGIDAEDNTASKINNALDTESNRSDLLLLKSERNKFETQTHNRLLLIFRQFFELTYQRSR